MYVLIAANPFSGVRENRRHVTGLVEALRRCGLDSRVAWDPAEWVAQLSDPVLAADCACVVAAGGDGTVRDIINEHPTVPLATLPLGNQNLFARHLGFGRDPGRLASAIARGQSRWIDLGRVGRRLFSLMVTAGFDAEVVHRVAQWRSHKRGTRRAASRHYLLPALGALAGYSYPPIELEADGARVTGAHVMVFNMPEYALGFPPVPSAQADDGRLDWLVLEQRGARRLLGYAWAVARGRHQARQDVQHGLASRIRLSSPSPAPVQIDGEMAGCTPIEIEVVPRALQVIVP